MVLIFSKNDDYSTSCVIKWLIKNKVNYLRLNEDDVILIKSLTNDDFIFSYNNIDYSYKSIVAIWYRRGDINIKNISTGSFNEYLRTENKAIQKYIYLLFSRKKHINTFLNADFNKLELFSFKELNLNLVKIPNSILTQNKKEVSVFFNQFNEKIISKPISIPFSLINKSDTYLSYTSKIIRKDIEQLPDVFVPTLFQEEIDKKFEIRTFILNKKSYSMCIFSQNNNQTKVDFRNYDDDMPNRLSPFKLPVSIEEDIFKLLDCNNIDCASIDLIYTHNKEFYLIDINPVGQFGMTSHPCNYNIEKLIADYLK